MPLIAVTNATVYPLTAVTASTVLLYNGSLLYSFNVAINVGYFPLLSVLYVYLFVCKHDLDFCKKVLSSLNCSVCWCYGLVVRNVKFPLTSDFYKIS